MKDLSLQLILPKRLMASHQKIIEQKSKWIEKKYLHLLNRKLIINDNQILYNGEYYELEVSYSDKASVNLFKNKILISITNILDSKTLLYNWMTEETEKILNKNIPQLTQKLGVKASNVRVKKTVRWGYCKRKGELTFNWQLAALPRDLAEYIIIHEITHLSEFNHSKKFKAKLASLCPDFKDKEIRLNNYYLDA